MIEYDFESDENSLICLFDNNKVFYTIVQREPELHNTGMSIIKRILKDRHKFIGDFYSTQSYFMIKYIDEDNIKPDTKFSGADRNEMSIKELDSYLMQENTTYKYIYVYDVSKDTLIIKENFKPLYYLDFHNRLEIEEFIVSNSL